MKKSDWPSISFLFRMTVRTCFLLYYNFCLWNYVKELCSAQRSDGPEWSRIPHLRVQRYNFSANRQNNQILFLKNIPRQQHYTLYYLYAQEFSNRSVTHADDIDTFLQSG